MSGKKRFSEDDALRAVLPLFRQKGYAATSMSDLEQATGLKKSSIYNAFDSKEQLYARALDFFHVNFTSNALKRLQGDHFIDDMEQFFTSLSSGFVMANGKPGGCVATLAALEMGDSDSFVREVIDAGVSDMLEAIEARILRAIDEGELTPQLDAAGLAAMILAVTRGAIVLNMAKGEPTHSHQAYQQLLSVLKGYQLAQA